MTNHNPKLQNLPREIRVIGAASGWGAQLRATEKGPEALHALDCFTDLCRSGLNFEWDSLILPRKMAENLNLPLGKPTLPYVLDHCQRLAVAVEEVIEKDHFPAVIGGDHAIAMGTWTGVTTALNAAQKFGLIWIDAHMDSHTPETSPSQAYHGMPLACLMGYGEPELVEIGSSSPKLSPQHVVLMGIRSFESGERALLDRLGVRIFYVEEIHERGFAVCLKEALSIVNRNTSGFGITIDLDAFDPDEAPGVGSPEGNGLRADPVCHAFRDLVAPHPQFAALEITEYNPQEDKDHKTGRLACRLMRELLSQ
ncbi:MAG: arginase [Holosporales bacterium]